jgi:D-alanyl-lipoteichoic acid acyltransferase DltB (MBOAT superfamily)
MSGLGFSIDKETGKPVYNSMRVVNIRPLLPLITVHEFTIHWNIQTHLWLKYYVMLRLIDRKAPRNASKHLPTLVTFIVSSIWHGVYPGYIVFFVACGFLTLQTKIAPNLKVIKRLQSLLPPVVCQILSAVYSHFMVSYFGLAFLFLKAELFNKMFVNYHWAGHWILLVATALCFVLPTERTDQKKNK